MATQGFETSAERSANPALILRVDKGTPLCYLISIQARWKMKVTIKVPRISAAEIRKLETLGFIVTVVIGR